VRSKFIFCLRLYARMNKTTAEACWSHTAESRDASSTHQYRRLTSRRRYRHIDWL